ncbi:MAG: hypothetical protein C0599_13775 [Salinivirgaceae bacterium]|nr:MAG: hypothetical protein C0599_13775 [Salinivirgaceae bacterium]
MQDFKWIDNAGFPDVIGKWDEGAIELIGDANPNDIHELFIPLNQWVFNYLETRDTPLQIIFKLTYLNTSFSLGILDLIRQLNSSFYKQKNVSAFWYYQTDDEELYYEGEDFKSVSHFPFELISV